MLGLANLAKAAPIQSANSPTFTLIAQAEQGKTIFQQKCAACHSVGGGNIVGPDLKGVSERRDRQWLVQFISAPDKMISRGDPIALQLLKQFNNIQMPNPGLSEAEVDDVIAYLEIQSGIRKEVAAPQPPFAPGKAVAGVDSIGREFFTGVIRLQNQGPPCVACHSVAGIGTLGGGALGPDLTQAFNKYGDTGIASVLATLPFPTMKPIYDYKPLTVEEQAHLIAFLQAVSAQPSTQVSGTLALLTVAGFILLMLLAHIAWRRRLRAVRRSMVEQKTRLGMITSSSRKGAAF